MISDRRIAALAAVFGMLFVSACGGGGGGSTPIESNEELVERIRSDPRVVRLSEVAADANTLLVSSIYAPFSVTVLDENGAPVQQNDELVQGFECTGNSCVNVNSQIPYAVENFVPLNADIELTETNLGPQGGFDTLTTGVASTSPPTTSRDRGSPSPTVPFPGSATGSGANMASRW